MCIKFLIRLHEPELESHVFRPQWGPIHMWSEFSVFSSLVSIKCISHILFIKNNFWKLFREWFIDLDRTSRGRKFSPKVLKLIFKLKHTIPTCSRQFLGSYCIVFSRKITHLAPDLIEVNKVHEKNLKHVWSTFHTKRT